jgi:hypothetical protein
MYLLPTLSFSASPLSITSGQSSALSWSSTNATSCTASGGWSGTKEVNGSATVIPTANTIYTLSCTGTGGTANGNVTVTVSQSILEPPITPLPTSTFSIGDWIQVTIDRLSVRSLPTTLSRRLGVQYGGSKGQITSGPVQADGYNWYQIDYTSIPDGWSVDSGYLAKTVAPSAIGIGSRITVTEGLKIRSSASGTQIGRQGVGSQGVIVGGPVLSQGYTWWNVNFDSGTDGWCVQNYLSY